MKTFFLSLLLMTNLNAINFYPMSAIVTEINYTDDLVTITDFEGYSWQFYGVEDWHKNDICACIMNDMGTETIYDDEIIKTHYCGWIK